MPAFTLSRPDVFPSGTTVYAYQASNWSQAALPPTGAPVGASSGSAVATNTGVTFPNLLEDVAYYAYGLVSGEHRYVSFKVDTVSTPGAALSKKNGQAGMLAPSSFGFTPTPNTLVANQGRISRFVPSEDMLVRAIGFATTVAATADDPCDVAIYDGTGTRLGASAVTTGRLNSIGPKEIVLTAPLSIKGGSTYYAALACGAIGGTAGAVMGVSPLAAGPAQLFGATIGLVEIDGSASRHPLPATWTITAASMAGFLLAVKE